MPVVAGEESIPGLERHGATGAGAGEDLRPAQRTLHVMLIDDGRDLNGKVDWLLIAVALPAADDHVGEQEVPPLDLRDCASIQGTFGQRRKLLRAQRVEAAHYRAKVRR